MGYFLLFVKYSSIIIRKVLDKIYPGVYKHMNGLELGKGVIFWGNPIIDIRYGGKIIIGKDVRIISTNVGTHVNYGSPTKLMADRPEATIVIGDNSEIAGACIHAYKSIYIGKNCIIGTGTNIFDANGHPTSLKNYESRRVLIDDADPIVIGDNVWVALGCVVLPGTDIGEGTIVGANSVVRGRIPANCIVAGNPAGVVKDLS